VFVLRELVKNYLMIDRNWYVACGNRFVTWYFRLGELLSPERKHQDTHLCSCAKSRLGELESPERDTIASRQTSLAWARVRPGFSLFALLVSRLGETGSPERDNLSPRLDFLDEYKLWEDEVKMKFQGKSKWNCSVCKDVRNL